MAALILEGGGMRAAFTAGVLDYWMSRGLYFKDVYGISAGACQACSYLCRQLGRGLRVWLNYLNDPRFCSAHSLLTTGDLFGAELNYHLVPRELDPLDNAAYQSSGARLFAGVTDVATGKSVFLPIRDMWADVEIIRASASLPLVSNIVEIDGRGFLDGGVSDSIPVRRAMADGHLKNVVVLTQAEGYRKQPNKALPLMRARYRRYPRLVDAVAHRHEMYNAELDDIAELERSGSLFVLRPEHTPQVGRVEKDPEKLKKLHDEGVEAASRSYNHLMTFLDEI